MRANANAGLQLVSLFVVLVLLAQPLAAALDCWWMARTTSECDGQCEISLAPAQPNAGHVFLAFFAVEVIYIVLQIVLGHGYILMGGNL